MFCIDERGLVGDEHARALFANMVYTSGAWSAGWALAVWVDTPKMYLRDELPTHKRKDPAPVAVIGWHAGSGEMHYITTVVPSLIEALSWLEEPETILVANGLPRGTYSKLKQLCAGYRAARKTCLSMDRGYPKHPEVCPLPKLIDIDEIAIIFAQTNGPEEIRCLMSDIDRDKLEHVCLRLIEYYVTIKRANDEFKKLRLPWIGKTHAG